MTTGQKYVGKADNANPIEQTGSNSDLSVHNGTSAVNTADQTAGEPNDEEELTSLAKLTAPFPTLTEADIIMLTGLYATGAGVDEVRAHAHRLAQHPINPNRSTAIQPQGDLSVMIPVSVRSRNNSTSSADVLLWALQEYRDSRLNYTIAAIRIGDFVDAHNHQRDYESAQSLLIELQVGVNALANKNYWASIGQPVDTADQHKEENEDFLRYLTKQLGLSKSDATEYLEANDFM